MRINSRLQFTFILCLLLCQAMHAQTLPGFQPDYETALQLSQEKNQVLMLDFYTDWCKPCKKLDREVYGSEEFFPYTSQLSCVKIDYESEEGKKIGEKYNVSTFPTIVFVTPNGEEIERITSYFPKSRYLPNVERIIEGKNTVPQMEARFPEGTTYADLFHLSYYFMRRVYVPEKSNKYYQQLLSLDPGHQRDSTHMITQMLHYLAIDRGVLEKRSEAEKYVIDNAARPYIYELAIEISESYINEEEYTGAREFFDAYLKAKGTAPGKQEKSHLKQLNKLMKK